MLLMGKIKSPDKTCIEEIQLIENNWTILIFVIVGDSVTCKPPERCVECPG